MKAHVVEDGVVTNTVIVNSLSDLPNLVEATSGGIGWTYDGSSFTDPNALTQSQLNEIKSASNRSKRNDLLAACDWTQANDSPLSNDKKIEWASYRTLLRDLPSNKSWPNVTFPEEPS